MAANMQELDNILALRVQSLAEIRQLASFYFLPEKPAEIKDPAQAADFTKKMANATGAVELVCSLMNVFGTMAGLKNYSSESAIVDLTFGLNTNPFWVTNAAYLMPLVSASINAFEDNRKLRTNPQPLWKNLELHQKQAWLEVLPAILYCLKGYGSMREKSLEVKQAFEKFLRAE